MHANDPGVWRWSWLKVAKYAAGFVVFIFLMVGITELLRWLVGQRTLEIGMCVGFFAFLAFLFLPDLRDKFGVPVVCAISLILGVLIFAGLMLLAKYVVLSKHADTYKWIFVVFVFLGWAVYELKEVLQRVRQRHAAKKR